MNLVPPQPEEFQLQLEVLYLVASVLFVLGIRGLTSPVTARRGVILAELGMVAAVWGTLLHPDIVTMDIVMPRRSGIDAVRGIIEVDSSAKKSL